MTLWSGPFLPFLALLWPLGIAAVALLPGMGRLSLRLLPLAPVPALWLGLVSLAGPVAGPTLLPEVLLGVWLGLDPGRGLLLAMTAFLWIVAALAAQRMGEEPRIAAFAGFWALTLTGNLGVLLSEDIATFYVSFAAVSLAAWILIVHDRSAAALRAGRVYIIMAILGEVALLAGLLLGANAAGTLIIADIRTALALAPEGPLAITLLLIGFGVKAGLVPLHMWLPLAHPAAPVPASAVLSGAIVKAGLVGMIVLLPEAAAGQALILLGATGAFGAALWGLTQSNPKAVLAYSTISQMGLMILLIGAGAGAPEGVAYYALHHGLAKGGLFLLVGVMYLARAPGQRRLVLAAAALGALSMAGLPLTGGALAKAAAKGALSADLALLLTLSSVTTTLVMGWFLWRLSQIAPAEADSPYWSSSLALPVLAVAAAQAGPWLLAPAWSGLPPGYAFKASTLADGAWPIALALAALALLIRRPPPQIPPGDLLALGRKVALPPLAPPSIEGLAEAMHGAVARLTAALTTGLATLEAGLIRWRHGGIALLLAVIALGALLG
jgi:hydrogenase-4 component B